MQLSPLDLFVQEQCLLAAHNTDDIEKARHKEIKTIGCLLSHGFGNISPILGYGSKHPIISLYGGLADSYSIVGLPPTLSRILNAFEKSNISGYTYVDGYIYHSFFSESIEYDFNLDAYKFCPRKLLQDSGEDCTFFDQSDETKLAIAKIMGYVE